MTFTVYYAVSGTGQGCVFTTEPVRDEHRKVWHGTVAGCVSAFVMLAESEGFSLPPLKWTDNPVRISIDICTT